MTKQSTIRAATALFVLFLCLPAIVRGADILRFSVADDNDEDTRPWANVSGLAFSALESSLTPVAKPEDVPKRRDDLTEILSMRPLASEYWLTLAGTRITAGEPLSKALDALTLSSITAPNEGYLIAQRGIFGVSYWEALPPEVRNRAMDNLAARRLSGRNAERLRNILAEKTPNVRDAIRTALRARGLSAESFSRIGL
jgi:hypothetical protein